MFPSLTRTPSARLASFGTNFATFYDSDINIALTNQSLLPRGLSNFATINYAEYFSAYSEVNVNYVHDFRRIGTFLGSFQYANYGSVENCDPHGHCGGWSNHRYDIVLNVGWGRALDSSFSIGANFKYIFSRLQTNLGLHGIAVDVNASYVNTEERWATSLAFRNIGTMLQRNVISEYEELPFEIVASFYKRLEHAPFAFSLTLANLQRWNLSGVDINDESVNKISAFADNAMRHIVPGIEILPFRNFAIRVGYNYHHRQEYKTATRPGVVGFSLGVGVKIYRFHLDYTRSAYHLAGGVNHISLSSNLSDF
jgi:hypothetical protein